MSEQARNYLWIILLVVLLIAAPVVLGMVALLWLVYWNKLGGKQNNGQLITDLRSIKPTNYLLAWALALLTLSIHRTVDQATQFGFPATVITYYTLAGAPTFPISWSTIISRIAINPLQAVINMSIYLLLILMLDKVWTARSQA